MAIRYFTEDIKFVLAKKRNLEAWIQSILNSYNLTTGDINYIFTSDANILSLNKKYLNHFYFTDIITFDFNEKSIVSGDIYISIETVESNAKLFSTSFLDELYRVMIHGVLHLAGLNDSDEEEKTQMRIAENNALNSFQINKQNFPLIVFIIILHKFLLCNLSMILLL